MSDHKAPPPVNTKINVSENLSDRASQILAEANNLNSFGNSGIQAPSPRKSKSLPSVEQVDAPALPGVKQLKALPSVEQVDAPALPGAKQLKALPAETEDNRIMKELGYDPDGNISSGDGFGIKEGKSRKGKKKKGASYTPPAEKSEKKKGSTRKERRKERTAQRQFEREMAQEQKKLERINQQRQDILSNPNIDEIEKRVRLEEMVERESPETAKAFKMMTINEVLTNPAQSRRPRTKIKAVPITEQEGIAVDTGILVDRGGRMKDYTALEPQFKEPDKGEFTATRRFEPAKDQPEPVYGDEFEVKKRGELNVKPLTPEEEARQQGELANNLAYFMNHNATAKYRNGGQNYVEYMTQDAETVKELKQQLEREKKATNKPAKDLQERLTQHYTNVYSRAKLTKDRAEARARAEDTVKRLYGDAKELREEYNKSIDDKLKAIENGQLRDNPDGGIDDLGMKPREINRDEFKYIRDNLDPRKWVSQEELQEKFLTGLRDGVITRMKREQAQEYVKAATKGTIGTEMSDLLADMIASGDIAGRRLYEFLKIVKIKPQEINDAIERAGKTPMTRRQVLTGGFKAIQRGTKEALEGSVYSLSKDPSKVRWFSNYLEREMRIKTIEFFEDVDNGWMVRKDWTDRLLHPFSGYYDEELSLELLDLKRANRAPLSKLLRDFARGAFGQNPMSVEGVFRKRVEGKLRNDSAFEPEEALKRSRYIRRDLMAKRIANELELIYAA